MHSYDQALSILLSHARLCTKNETLSLNNALGRILAQDISSNVYVPPMNNSVLDGYALRSADVSQTQTTRLKVTQRIPAGALGSAVKHGECARIFTGAPIPQNADCILAQEQATKDGEYITFDYKPKTGEDIRFQGEDITQGQIIAHQGDKITPRLLGLIASIGLAKISVYKPITVALLTTGDELLEPGQPPQAGKIFNANHTLLKGLLTKLGMNVIDKGCAPDDLELTQQTLKEASSQADVIISSGGVSVGEEDYVKMALESLGGSIDLWRVAMKPGKPFAFGHIDNTPFIGLPGNPVSTFASFLLFARPFIFKMQGRTALLCKPYQIRAGFDWSHPDSRKEFIRVQYSAGKDGQPELKLYPNQSSGALSSTVWADGFAVIEPNTSITQGDLLPFMPFSGFFE